MFPDEDGDPESRAACQKAKVSYMCFCPLSLHCLTLLFFYLLGNFLAYNVVPCMLYWHSLYTTYSSTLNPFNEWMKWNIAILNLMGEPKDEGGVMHTTDSETCIIHPLKLHKASCCIQSEHSQNIYHSQFIYLFNFFTSKIFPLFNYKSHKYNYWKNVLLAHVPFEHWLTE